MEIHDVALLLESRPVDAKKVGTKPRVLRTGLSTGQLNLFARTLGGLLEGGVPILKALEGLEKASSNRTFKGMLRSVQENVRRGVGLSEALEKSGGIPSFFYQTVYGGEVSGRVPQVLGELARYAEKEQALKRGIRDALVYPAFIVAVGFATLAVLTCFVLPKLQNVYTTFGTELPFITRMILGMSRAFLPLAAVFAAGGVHLFWSLRKKGYFAEILYKAPFVGDFVKGFMRARFARLFSLLLESGIPVLESLSVVEKTFKNPVFQQDVAFLRKSLAAGGGFSNCLDKIEWMDSVSRMLVVSGEETGHLSASFSQIARDTELELEAGLHLAVKLLEPALILAIGLSVGFVVIGTVLPVFDMSSIVR